MAFLHQKKFKEDSQTSDNDNENSIQQIDEEAADIEETSETEDEEFLQ